MVEALRLGEMSQVPLKYPFFAHPKTPEHRAALPLLSLLSRGTTPTTTAAPVSSIPLSSCFGLL